ncbi:hypothetical protein [Metabacillus sp. Hm71]|uniref:hypothetical protein n=1 Tax=Metabacillus sp. Hm71 TaxID=3450743 RepID=UPI003F43F4D5
MKDHMKQAAKAMTGRPVGNITPIGNNGYGKDEAGQIFQYRSQEQLEAIEKERNKKKDLRHFSFSHMMNIREVTDNLTNKQCGYILMLQPYLQFKTNVLILMNADESPMTEKELAIALKVTPKTIKKVVENLITDDVLSIDKSGYYRMNERYHFRKKVKEDESMLIKTFFTTLKQLKLKPAELGVLYKLLPYVHYETNMICANPFEEVPADIRFLTTKQIAEVIGMHEKKAIEVLRELKKSGAIAETTKFVEDARVKYITLNPFIFYRQSGKPDTSLAAMFLSRPNK